MSGKRILKLVDKRSVPGQATSEMRHAMRDIRRGDVTGIGIALTYRNGDCYAWAEFENPVTGIGAAELLREYILRHDLNIKKSY